MRADASFSNATMAPAQTFAVPRKEDEKSRSWYPCTWSQDSSLRDSACLIHSFSANEHLRTKHSNIRSRLPPFLILYNRQPTAFVAINQRLTNRADVDRRSLQKVYALASARTLLRHLNSPWRPHHHRTRLMLF